MLNLNIFTIMLGKLIQNQNKQRLNRWIPFGLWFFKDIIYICLFQYYCAFLNGVNTIK